MLKTRRLTASEELKVLGEKKLLIAHEAAAGANRRSVALELVTERKYQIWLQTVFPAQHANLMHAHISAMAGPALDKLRTQLHTMQANYHFKRWLTIDPLWVSDNALLFNFGSIADLDKKLSGPASRKSF